MKPTGLHDIHGIPVCVGDLIRVKHYTHYRNRRQMYAYFVVVEIIQGRFYVRSWNDMRPDGRQCLLQDAGPCEVLAESGVQYDERGRLMTFNERPRRKAERLA